MFGFESGTSCIRSGSVNHLTTTFGVETGCKDRRWIESYTVACFSVSHIELKILLQDNYYLIQY
jgi:hypothetical protein